VVTAAHEIPNRPPLRLNIGDRVVVGKRDVEWPEFVFVTSDAGAGWVPARHLSASGGVGSVVVAYDTTELATEVGEILEVLSEDLESGWLWCRAASGSEGWVPLRTLAEPGPGTDGSDGGDQPR
jgi:hypothetical protein